MRHNRVRQRGADARPFWRLHRCDRALLAPITHDVQPWKMTRAGSGKPRGPTAPLLARFPRAAEDSILSSVASSLTRDQAEARCGDTDS